MQAFGKACRIVVDNADRLGEERLTACRDEISRLESKFSAYREESVISRINQSAGTGSSVLLDDESQSLFRYVDALWNESKHIFDPTTRLLQDCYDEQGRLRASPGQLQGMLTLVGWKHLESGANGVHLAKKGMLIDLNSCVRPYVIDCVRKLLEDQGTQHALLEIDRDIATLGKQPDGPTGW